MNGDHNMNQTTSDWRKRQIALDKKAENARELGLDYEPDKTIMQMAREAGMCYREFEDEFANANTDGVDLKTIETFAALIRADERDRATRENAYVLAEREACARLAEEWLGPTKDRELHIAEAIRARGDKHD